jgi:hypothetical protein
MTVIVTTFVDSKFLENAQTTQYTSSNVTSIIDSAVIFNDTAGAVTVDLHLVNSGGTADTSNIFISRSINVGENYKCPEITGQTLKNGQFISTVAGSASALTCRVSGRQIS